jgi:hypothetical protein
MKSPPGGSGGDFGEVFDEDFIEHRTAKAASPQLVTAIVSPVSAQQVSFWSVHEYIAPLLEKCGRFPTVGTPEWVALPDDDPRKIAAVFDAAQHHALRLETNQQAMAEASHDIADAEDWSDIATQIQWRRDAYIPRRAS